MSMIHTMYAVTDADIAAVEQQPLKLEVLRYGTPEEDFLENLSDDVIDDLLGWYPSPVTDRYCLEGAFMPLHWLLTGQAESNTGTFPLNFLAANRIAIGEVGWGPANFFYSADVKEIALALNQVDYTTLELRFDDVFFEAQKKHPRTYNWHPADSPSLIRKLKEVTDFIHKLATENKGMYSTLT